MNMNHNYWKLCELVGGEIYLCTIVHVFQCVLSQKLCVGIYFLKNGPTPASFSFIFGLFNQTLLQFLQQVKCQKCPSNIRCRDSNSQPSDYESLPLTTRPGLTPLCLHLLVLHFSLSLLALFFAFSALHVQCDQIWQNFATMAKG